MMDKRCTPHQMAWGRGSMDRKEHRRLNPPSGRYRNRCIVLQPVCLHASWRYRILCRG
jgi:hypothetical protein